MSSKTLTPRFDPPARFQTFLAQVRIISRYEFLNYTRTKRFLGLTCLVILLSIGLTGDVTIYHDSSLVQPALSFYYNWWGKFLAGFVAALAAVFFGGDAISGEFQNKTGYFLIGNPVRRPAIYVGKFAAAFLASLFVLVLCWTIGLASGVIYLGTGGLSYQYAMSLGFSILYLSGMLGFTFVLSSVMKSTTMSVLFSATILLLLAFDIVQEALMHTYVEPWFLLSYGGQLVGAILMSPFPPHLTTYTDGINGHALHSFNPTIPEGVVIMLVYAFVGAAIGLVAFKTREFS